MSLSAKEVQWSPVHNNKFITWGTEICLYEVGPLKEIVRQSCIKISEKTVAHLLATNTNYQYIKCIDIYPQPEPDILLAVGQANGKIVLTTFGPTAFDSLDLTGKELTPKYARCCNAVSWNPVDPNLIVCGLDKYRSDHSILLWDVLKLQSTNHSNNNNNNNNNGQTTDISTTIRPISEACISETAHSIAWFNNESRCLIAGLNNKYLKMIDFRDSNKIVNTTSTKAVYSVSINPHNYYHLVSHYDNQITIWDTRYFEKPLLTLTQNRPIIKVLWCPTRRNLLGSLQKDSNVLHLHDIQHCGSAVGADETEPGALERTVAPPSWLSPTSFSWHPNNINRLLGLSIKGTTDYTVCERITLNWSTRSHLSWNHASKTFKYVSSSDSIYDTFDDIAILTKKRAISEYGLLSELASNGELAENNELKNLWQWLYLSRSLVEDGTIISHDNKHPGVRSVLKLDDAQFYHNNNINNNSGFIKSDIVNRLWIDIGSINHTAKIYKSSDRDKALQLCGWKFDSSSSSSSNNNYHNNVFLEKLERQGAYARATAISVFNLCLRQAIDILNRGAAKLNESTNLNIVAMALSGYSEDKNSMWRELCLKSINQLTDPYLRATFSFLTADNDSYDNVLNENGIAVEDRVGFALMFLSDSKLIDYLKRMTIKLTNEGNLACFLLTGATQDGIKLLNKYLDVTGDVQSCCLIAIRALSSKLLQDNSVQSWINNYRSLLDAWKMWNQRAHFDIIMRLSTNEKPPQQVYISCNFCGKSISAFMQGLRGPFSRLGGTSNKLKMSSCPNCRKPLPRCAICLMNMGTVSGFQMPNAAAAVAAAAAAAASLSSSSSLSLSSSSSLAAAAAAVAAVAAASVTTNNTNTTSTLSSSSSSSLSLSTTTAIAAAAASLANRKNDDGKLTEFGNWFTWCQTCRHGGHTEHITHWFRQHTECPVTSCTCRCFSLDPL